MVQTAFYFQVYSEGKIAEGVHDGAWLAVYKGVLRHACMCRHKDLIHAESHQGAQRLDAGLEFLDQYYAIIVSTFVAYLAECL